MKKDYLLGIALKEIGFKRKKIKDPYQMYVKNYGGERIFFLIIDSNEIVDMPPIANHLHYYRLPITDYRYRFKLCRFRVIKIS